jgi:hypothetical protein
MSMSAPTFTPADWLASFEEAGGAYGTDGRRLVLAIIPGQRPDMSHARLLVAALTDTQRAEVVRHLGVPVMMEG